MPKIPLPQNRTVSHVAAETPLTGGGLQMRYYGDGIDANAVSSGLKSIGSAMVQFTKEYNETENRLAAAEDRALFNQTFEELQLQLADNPGASDEEKEKWINEAQQNYLHDRVKFTDRMTAKFRESHDLQMNDLQRAAGNRQLLILNQAKVQRQLDEVELLYKNLCQRGDFEGAKTLIEESTGTLFNSETAGKFLEQDLPMRQEFYMASKLADVKPDQLASALEETDKEGNYTQYTNLSLESRKQLLRYAKGKGAEQLTDYTQNYIAQINSGTLTESSESFKKKFAEGQISKEQFNMVMPYIKRYEEQNAKNIAAEKQQEIRLKQLRSDDAAGAFIYQTIYNSDGTKKSYSEAEIAPLRVKLLQLCGGSVSLAEKYMPKLNSALAPSGTTAAAKGTTKNSMWSTPEGKVIDSWQKTIANDKNAFRWDPAGMEDSDDWSDEQKLSHHLRMELQYRELAEDLFERYKNPKDVIDVLSWARKQLNDGTISSFLQWRETNLPAIDKRLGIPRGQKNENFRKTGR